MDQKEDFIIAPPAAASLMEALRGVGYTLQTAVSDIIDNSISHGASKIQIFFNWDGDKSSIVILDDGRGMNSSELSAAMHIGSKNPRDTRSSEDLGRFGLGLKTAAFSQCRKLTVVSKQGIEVQSRCWDLDYISRPDVNAWKLLVINNYNLLPQYDLLKIQDSGTLVILQNIDRITEQSLTAGKQDQEHFYKAADNTLNHIAMVFHQFLEDHSVKILVNGNSVKPWDPFLRPLSAPTPVEHIKTPNGIVSLQGFILPHKDRLDPKTYEYAGGINGWNSQQGFYVYRNKRLLVAGGWLGLGYNKSWTREEAFKLARIKIDITNSSDDDWKIDIKKSIASPPVQLRNRLRQLADTIRSDARKVLAHRGAYGSRPVVPDLQHIWKAASKGDHVIYRIDRKHPAIKAVLERFETEQSLVESMLKTIEQTVPVQKIWLDVSEKGELTPNAFEDTDKNEVKGVLETLFRNMIGHQNMSPEQAREYLGRTDPFQNFPDLIVSLKAG